jgi:hypothetical protein
VIILSTILVSIREDVSSPYLIFSASKVTALNAEKSPAVPFLPYPENLKGYVGDDIAFDPLRISDYFPMDYLRESELK